jgi:hypothetical protein
MDERWNPSPNTPARLWRRKTIPPPLTRNAHKALLLMFDKYLFIHLNLLIMYNNDNALTLAQWGVLMHVTNWSPRIRESKKYPGMLMIFATIEGADDLPVTLSRGLAKQFVEGDSPLPLANMPVYQQVKDDVTRWYIGRPEKEEGLSMDAMLKAASTPLDDLKAQFPESYKAADEAAKYDDLPF